MILAAAVPIGLIAGALLRGSLDNLATVRLRWAWVAVAGLAIQVALFSEVGWAMAGSLGPVIYVASTAAVLVAVLRNVRLTGMPIVAVGASANLAAVLANGGSMPTTTGALATAGLSGDAGSSVVVANPALAPLTDVLAIPAGIPLANVFSVGDVLIAAGIVVVIAAAMRSRPDPGVSAPAAP